MAKIEIDTEKCTFLENNFLSYEKLNMDCKMILRSLIAIRKVRKDNPVVSVGYFNKKFGISERKIRHSIRILENRKFLTPYLQKERDKEIYEFALNEDKISSIFSFFRF